ncbi:hypothetical protein LUZ60_016088 [Juncus effusus]|nr:hypothetical protein LUZ60_016088 [Juncus effusus]
MDTPRLFLQVPNKVNKLVCEHYIKLHPLFLPESNPSLTHSHTHKMAVPTCHCNSPPNMMHHQENEPRHHEPKHHHHGNQAYNHDPKHPHRDNQTYDHDPKVCHHDGKARGPPRQRVAKSSPKPKGLLCCGLLALIILLGIIALIVYLIYRPTHPRFSVTSLAILSLSNSSFPFTSVSTSIQLTILIKNPNSHMSISYDCLSAFFSYRNQAITYATQLPTITQQPHSSLAVSPVVGGGVAIPVSNDVVDGLMNDEITGILALRLVVQGRIRFEPRPFYGRWGPFYMRCEMLVATRKGFGGQVPLLGNPNCYADP